MILIFLSRTMVWLSFQRWNSLQNKGEGFFKGRVFLLKSRSSSRGDFPDASPSSTLDQMPGSSPKQD